MPPGADAEVGDATTVIFVYERLFTPNVGLEFVLGVPPRLKAKATGSVAFLGDDVLSAKNVAPTLLLNYHFFTPSDALRPYLGAGINYTHFTNVKSSLAPDVKMGSSTGLALQAGLNYAINKDWGLFASIAKINVKSKVVAVGTTVLTTTVDFRPLVYSGRPGVSSSERAPAAPASRDATPTDPKLSCRVGARAPQSASTDSQRRCDTGQRPDGRGDVAQDAGRYRAAGGPYDPAHR